MLSRTEHRGVCRLLSSVMSGTETHADRQEDFGFLRSMLMEKKLHLLFKIHERLKRFEKRSPVPPCGHASALASHLLDDLSPDPRVQAKELLVLLCEPHFKSLLWVHDAVAQRQFEPRLPPLPEGVGAPPMADLIGATIRRDVSTGAILVARIMKGGAADKSVIPADVNNEQPANRKTLFVRALFDYDPKDDPSVPCKEAALTLERGNILQVLSQEDDTWWQARRHGDNHTWAGLIPSEQLHQRRVTLQRPEALFKPRCVQPRVKEGVDYGAISGIRVGKTFNPFKPSQGSGKSSPTLQMERRERRRAVLDLLTSPEALELPEAGQRRSFQLGQRGGCVTEAHPGRGSPGLEGPAWAPAYLEVVPYRRGSSDRQRLVLLVGPAGVGVSELQRRLLVSDPDCFGVTVPHTSRERRAQEQDGVDYHFVSQRKFEEDILNHSFIEYGMYRGHYYGTSLDSVGEVTAEGKVCLVSVDPRTIRSVYTAALRPYVVFVKPPRVEQLRLTRRRAKFTCTADQDPRAPAVARMFSEEDFEDMIRSADAMETEHGHMFDAVVVNGDAATALGELRAALEKVSGTDLQWIPAESRLGGVKVRHRRQALQDMARPLKHWLYKHRDNPYPTKTEKVLLALGSHMTLVQ
ncbi:hypothetical protein NHX12_004930, partial [Muraenolepis orangiensis]